LAPFATGARIALETYNSRNENIISACRVFNFTGQAGKNRNRCCHLKHRFPAGFFFPAGLIPVLFHLHLLFFEMFVGNKRFEGTDC